MIAGDIAEPNVVGTAEIIRLALTERLKPVAFISTVGTAMPGVHPALDELAEIRAAAPYRMLHNVANVRYPIERIDDYQDSRRHFGAALRQLPNAVRQYTATRLINAFDEPATRVAGSPAPADHFRSRISSNSDDIPELMATLDVEYLSDLKQLRLLPEPTT